MIVSGFDRVVARGDTISPIEGFAAVDAYLNRPHETGYRLQDFARLFGMTEAEVLEELQNGALVASCNGWEAGKPVDPIITFKAFKDWQATNTGQRYLLRQHCVLPGTVRHVAIPMYGTMTMINDDPPSIFPVLFGVTLLAAVMFGVYWTFFT